MIRGYESYKDSGTDWIKKFPAHWDVVKAKRLFATSFEKGHVQEPLLSVTQDQGVIPRDNLEDRVVMPLGEVDHYKLVEIGDFVISLRSFEGGIEYSRFKGLVSPAYTVLRPTIPLQERYFEYLFKSCCFVDALNAVSTGIRQGKNINFSDFADLWLPLPPKDEQQAIALHIEEKLKGIDRFIAAKQQLITRLEEQRAAVVNRAVTKGLDPDAPMKPSGIAWLGEIPAHWEDIRLRYVVSFISSGSRGWAKYYDEHGEALFIRIGNLTRDSIDLDLNEVERVSLPEKAEGTRTRIKNGDVLISITAYIGSVATVTQDLGEAYVSQHIALTRPRKEVLDPEWMGYALASEMGSVQFDQALYGGTKDGLSLADVKDVALYIPSLDEQEAIVRHIRRKTEEINAAIERAEQEITLIQEYRTALIAEVVTGQVDVRRAALA